MNARYSAYFGRLFRRLRRAYERNFDLIVFCALAVVQTVSGYLRSTESPLQWLTFVLMFGFCIAYYTVYFRRYIALFTLPQRGAHVYLVYSPWGVCACSFVFIFFAAQCLHVIQGFSPIVEGSPTYFAFVKFCIFKVTNNFSCDLLETFDWTSWRVTPTSDNGRVIIFIVGLFFQLIFLATLIPEVQRLLLLFKPFNSLLDWFEFPRGKAPMEPPKVSRDLLHQLKDKINSKSYSRWFEENVALYLLSFDAPECQEIYIRLLQDTDSKLVFQKCVTFFSHIRDDRRYRACLDRAILRDPRKAKWIQ